MPQINVIIDGDGAGADLKPDDTIFLEDAAWTLIRLRGGMTSGRSSLMLRIELPDGKTLLAQTSLGAWQMATAALKGAELRDGREWEGV